MERFNILSLLSADEKKMSALVFCLFILVGVAAVSYVVSGDISEHLKGLIETLVLSIAGLNVSEHLKDAVVGKNGGVK